MSLQKQKGNSFERDIAKLFTALSGESWIRTPHSGAYLGLSNSNRKNSLDDKQISTLLGDIANPTGYKLIIECKSYKDFSFNSLLSPKGNSKLNKWLLEPYYDSEKGNIPYCLCFKINNSGSYIVLPMKHFKILEPLIKLNYLKYQLLDIDTFLIISLEEFKLNEVLHKNLFSIIKE